MTARYLIIGCGNMGGAMLAGWLAGGVPAERFAVLDPALDAAPDGVELYRSADEVPGTHESVLLGFKPQQLGALAPGLQGLVGGGVAVHYLLAGLTLAQVSAAFPNARAWVRVMPNLAARLGKSPVLLAQSGLVTAERAPIHAFYDTLGTAVWLEDESRFDLLTALAGSGPGFVYRFIDALAQAAVQLGAVPDQANQLALAMVDGASSLAAGAEMTPGALANAVASPGGMTREGLNVLDADDALITLLTRTLESTADRGAALSRGEG
ncbi:MAG: pyrroline-5-carboxylate reductase dimerization domain-containing protein [Pseudomonadota bacterium]